MLFLRKLFGVHYSSEEIADAVVYEVAKDAFVHLRDRDFRRLLEWSKLSEEDQIQIRIELELGGIAFAYLLLEALEDHVEHPVSKSSARSVRNDLIPAFARHVEEDGPNPQLREALAQAIAQRCEECREDFRHRKQELDPEDLERIYWIEFCAGNTLNRLLADRPPEERDQDLYHNLTVWNMRLATNIQKNMLKRAKLTKLAEN